MARPVKQGIPYYSIYTDVFSDREIRRVLKNFGANGYLVYSYVLTEIYRDKGYFIVWDENTVFDVSDYLNLKETLVSEVINYCCNVGLFDKELLTSGGILTSKIIQEFWLPVVKKSNRTVKEINPKYNLLDVKKEESTGINEESTQNNKETVKINEESTQSKVKESKEKKRNTDEVKKNNTTDVLFSVEDLKEKYFKNKRMCDAVLKEKRNAVKNLEHLKKRVEEFVSFLSQRGIFMKSEDDFNSHFLSWHKKSSNKKRVDSFSDGKSKLSKYD